MIDGSATVLLDMPADVLRTMLSKAPALDICHAAQTCKALQDSLSPLLKKRCDEVHSQRCEDFHLAFFQIAKYGVDIRTQFSHLRNLANQFNPRPLRDQEPVEFFNQLFVRACRLCAKPTPSLSDDHCLLNDKGTQQLFDALSVFAAKLPVDKCLALLENCLEQSSKYVFMSVMSQKRLILQNFLLHLVALLPKESETNESKACEALNKVLYRFSGMDFFEEPEQFPSIEAFLTGIDGIKNEQQRVATLCKFIERYPAHSLSWTAKQAALDRLVTIIANVENVQNRYVAVCKLIEHYPASSRWPEKAFEPWQKLPALKTLLETAAGLSDLQMRDSTLHKIIETASIPQCEPGEAAEAIKAMLAAADTLTSDQERLNLMNAIMLRHRSDIPRDETEAVVSLLMTFSESLFGAAQRKSAINSIQRSFPKAYKHLLAERAALEDSAATL